jgi:hypothetical protein
MLRNFGFEPPIITDDWTEEGHQIDPILGAVVNPTGQWELYVPDFEHQATLYETWGCTVYGAYNQKESLEKYLYGETKDYDERYGYININVQPPGANPHLAYEDMRTNGLVHGVLPVPPTLEEYRNPSAITPEIRAQGIAHASRNKINHDWVLTGKKLSTEERVEIIKRNLTVSPIGASFTAWFPPPYPSKGQPNTHWAVIVGFTDTHWKVADSYPRLTGDPGLSVDDKREIKLVTFEHEIMWAKRMALRKISDEDLENTNIVLETLLKFSLIRYFADWWNRMFSPKLPDNPPMPVKSARLRLYDLARKNLGKNVRPLRIAPQHLGCAEAVSNLLSQLDPTFPQDTVSTVKLNAKLFYRFEQTKIYKPGCVIISPTDGTSIGHVGIMGEKEIIYSNNSITGLWDKHFTLGTWIQRYREQSNLPIYFYEPA